MYFSSPVAHMYILKILGGYYITKRNYRDVLSTLSVFLVHSHCRNVHKCHVRVIHIPCFRIFDI